MIGLVVYRLFRDHLLLPRSIMATPLMNDLTLHYIKCLLFLPPSLPAETSSFYQTFTVESTLANVPNGLYALCLDQPNQFLYAG